MTRAVTWSSPPFAMRVLHGAAIRHWYSLLSTVKSSHLPAKLMHSSFMARQQQPDTETNKKISVNVEQVGNKWLSSKISDIFCCLASLAIDESLQPQMKIYHFFVRFTFWFTKMRSVKHCVFSQGDCWSIKKVDHLLAIIKWKSTQELMNDISGHQFF